VTTDIAVVDPVVGDGILAANAGWKFSGATVDAFQPHVQRSVPYYAEGQELAAQLSDFFVRDDSRVYDIGTSLGAMLGKLVERHANRPDVKWIGIDVEADMVAQASKRFEDRRNVNIVQGDVVLCDLEQTDLVVSYYALQFIPPKFRQDVVTKIYQALHWGGAFIWFEKVRACDARFQDVFSALYNDFKLGQGFSPEEIIGKSRSLKGVLEPFSTEGNRGLLQRAGFVDVITVFKYLCFEGVLAIK
jgi:tRNA (cmo5U34)-methyltransferase